MQGLGSDNTGSERTDGLTHEEQTVRGGPKLSYGRTKKKINEK